MSNELVRLGWVLTVTSFTGRAKTHYVWWPLRDGTRNTNYVFVSSGSSALSSQRREVTMKCEMFAFVGSQQMDNAKEVNLN